MMKTIEVWLCDSSEPMVHEACITYQKGDLFCVYNREKELVYKYPIQHIFRIVEGYGSHGGDKIK